MLVGLGSCCKEDAQKCSCSFYTWLDVPKIKPTSKGSALKFTCYIDRYSLLIRSLKFFQAVLAYEKAEEILLRPEAEIDRPELLSLVQIHHAQVQ